MSLLFTEEHIEKIRAGEKTETRRDWAPQHNPPNPGSYHIAATEMFVSREEADCIIRIKGVRREPLGEMGEDAARAEGCESLAEFRDVWREINGEWTPEMEVTVVEFEHVGSEHPVVAEAA